MNVRSYGVRISFGEVVLRCFALGAVLGRGWSAAAHAQANERTLHAEDVFRLRSVTEAQISPDGRRIVYEQKAGNLQTDRMESSLWIIDSTGEHGRRLVDGVASNARWSPDSERVAYLANDAKGEQQIHVLAVASGHDAVITHLSQAPSDLAWSPDGRSVAFASFVPEPAPTLGTPLTKPTGATWAPPLRFVTGKHFQADGEGYVPPGHNHLFVVPAAGGEARQITSGRADDTSPVWSPDGADLVFTSQDSGAQLLDFDLQRISQVSVATGQRSQLSPDPIDAAQAALSPDGQHVAFIGYVNHRAGDFPAIEAYVMDRDGSHTHVLNAALDRVEAEPQWTADGRAVLISYVDHGVEKVGQMGLDGSFKVLVSDAVDSFSVARNGTLAFPLGAADRPEEVGVAARGGDVRRLTQVNAPWMDAVQVARLRPLPVRSSLDGTEVGAWMLLPPGYDAARRYPTLLEIHGGPYGADTPYWRTNSQLFAAAGYVVLYVNYRGSTSYGLKFSQAIDRNFPGPAYDDLMSAVDASVAAGVADPARLFVTGGSAGGELTAWILGKTHRFRAAAAVKPVINLLSQTLENDQYLYGATTEFAATPWNAPMLFWQHSPLSLVANVTTPTLVMVGEQDRRTPPDQSLQFYDALQIRGVPCGLVLVPGASHESLTSRPSQRAAEDLAILAWFARYGGPPALAQ